MDEEEEKMGSKSGGPLKVQSNALDDRSHDTRHGGLAAETPSTQVVRAESTEGTEGVEGGSPGVLGYHDLPGMSVKPG